MDSKAIRREFIEFFKEKRHQIVPSAPLVIKNDPTLMFTNAGMNQFKEYFLGNKKAKNPRVADTQKCLRVSGKHNDLEEVGLDTYHHTFFEMLGNWSFGDYFKKEAIEWAWELLTKVYKLPKERLYVSVFGGDEQENLAWDQEAFDIWKNIVGEDKIIKGSKKDNFWEMGDTGPCGPCSEIHIDMRPDQEVAKIPGKELVNQNDPLVMELWNLVFIQFNRGASGKLKNLPQKHVDTGMGFERLAMAVQGKHSNYDTDVFTPLIKLISKESGIAYGKNKEADIAIRVMADHIRAVAFAIADDQLPSNTKAGYVIRRILRRAVRYGYTFLGLKKPFMYKLVPVLAGQVEDIFPELKKQEEFISKVVHEEEGSFLRTLDRGLEKIDNYLERSSNQTNAALMTGNEAFELYDTYGFPLDLTLLIAREKGYKMDDQAFRKVFNQEMDAQKNRSKQASTVDTGDWITFKKEDAVEFVGYDQLESEAEIIKYRGVKDKKKNSFQIVLDRTPFYAESGGQVGDTGVLLSGNQKIKVLDTKKEHDLIIHITDKLPSDITLPLTAIVDEKKRTFTQNNHSATHLMHAALRKVLGTHVQQKGSLVNHKLLRFDFSHFAKMAPEEIREVEKIVNQKIRENIQLKVEKQVPIEVAKAKGAMALFGEKYGDFVRMVTFDDEYSVELCGGTHVAATGNIGLFKIIAESSIAAGVRRIEAITAEEAEEYINEQLSLISGVRESLKNPPNLEKAIGDLINDRNRLTKEVEIIRYQQESELKKSLSKMVIKESGINFVIKQLGDVSSESVKNISFQLNKEVDNLFMVIAGEKNNKPHISIAINKKLVEEKGLHAGNMVKKLAKEIKGGGGGQAFFATAGGSDVKGLSKVIDKAGALVKELLAIDLQIN